MYPKFDEILGKFAVSFSGVDWDYYNVHGLIDEIKQEIPKESREYDNGWWLFEPEYKSIVDQLIREHFG